MTKWQSCRSAVCLLPPAVGAIGATRLSRTTDAGTAACTSPVLVRNRSQPPRISPPPRRSNDKALFLIDEPDIYLHSDLQRQLIGLLRNLGPDIIIATHSTEIITEAEADDIVIIDKKRTSARRIRQPSELADVLAILGSNLNPIPVISSQVDAMSCSVRIANFH